MTKISIRECRELLDIHSRDTINEYLKLLGWFGLDNINWKQFQRILELQMFLGLKHGCNSKADFLACEEGSLNVLFASYGINIEQRLNSLKQQHEAKTHRVSVHLLVLND